MTKRILLVLVVLAFGAGGLFAGGGGEAKTGVTEITYQVWITPNLTREYYDGLVKAFEAKNPDIKVKIIEANANLSGSADDQIKTHLAAGDAADIWQNASVDPFARAGLLWEIPKNDPDLKKVNNLMSAAWKGKLYAFNNYIQPQALIFYNKKVWAQAGLTDTPKSWADFDAVCAKFAAAGITPMITGGEWVAGYVYDILTAPEIYCKNTQWYADRWAGKVHYTDANVVEAANRFRDMVEKGWFNKGALSVAYSDLEQQFLSGKGAMYPMGAWFTAAEASAKKDFEVGVFFSPTKSGAAHLLQSLQFGTTPVIYAKSKHPKEAWRLVKFWAMDPVQGAKALQVDGNYSALIPPLTYEMSPLQKALMDLLPTAKTTSGMEDLNIGEPPPPGILDEYNKIGQSILAGGVKDVVPLLKEMDAFWDQAKR
jgi:ABC-type glycerol-3-phosphate transport system substrate-binding protein